LAHDATRLSLGRWRIARIQRRRQGSATASSVSSPRAARDAARIDAGAKLAISRNAWLFASFDGEFSDRSRSYAGRGGARVAW